MEHRRSAIAIVNPATGRIPGDKIAWLMEKVLESKYDLEFRYSSLPGEERELARQAASETDLIIAVGGDGTVAHVAAGALGRDVDLAIVPNGSTNVIARGLGLPTDPFRASRALQRGLDPKWIDVGISGERVILHMAGSGLDSLMFRDTRPVLKRLFAWLAYVPPALKHLGIRPWRFELTIDGNQYTTDARMVLIANGSFVINPRFEVGTNIRLDDGYLDVLIFRPPNVAGALSLASWTALGRAHRSRYLYQVKAKKVQVDSTPAAPVEFDGDYIGMTPFEVEVRHRALRFLVPHTARSVPHARHESEYEVLAQTQRGVV